MESDPKSRRKVQFKLIATVYDKHGQVIAVGENSYIKTHPRMAALAKKCGEEHKQFLHAEVLAIIRCKGKIPYKIKIERYNKCGESRLAKPCPICELAIKEAGIKFVEYTI